MYSTRAYGIRQSLRFLRWSRRAFATFRSLGREVTIGHLAAHIVERLSLKSTAPKVYRGRAYALALESLGGEVFDVSQDDSEAFMALVGLLAHLEARPTSIDKFRSIVHQT